MFEIFLIQKIFVILIIITGFYVAFVVYFSNRKAIVNQLFLLMTINLLSWILFNHLADITNSVKEAIFFRRLVFSATAFFIFSSYFFTINFLKKDEDHPILNKVVLIFSTILFFLSIFTDTIVKGTRSGQISENFIKGSLANVFYILIIFFTLLIIKLLFKKYSKLSKIEKIKAQYFLIGTFVFAFANLIFSVFPLIFLGTYKYHWVGDYSTIIFLAFTAYAIVKHELMGIKTLLTQVLIVIISIILLVDIWFLSTDLTMQLLKLGILLAFLYFSRELVKSVRKEREARSELEETYERINQYVKQLEDINTNLEEKNNDLKALLESSNITTGTLDSKKIAQDIVDSIPVNLEHLGYKGGILVLYNKEKRFTYTYAITESRIVKKAKKLLNKPFEKHLEYIDKADNFVIQTIKTGEIHIGSKLEEFIAPTVNKNICKLIQKAVGAKSFISIPLFSRGTVVGVMVFVGTKPAQEIIQRDKNILFMFSSHIGSAIENAQLYEQTEKQIKVLSVLNENLKMANIKLKELLELKNEFLHITSHQLRTPLTVIRGMISMWYEGDFENLPEKEKRKMIKRILASVERLNNITNDMLDALELEGGFLKFQFKAISMEDIIKETINTLQPNFNKKGIYIKLAAEPDIPNVEVEPNYIRQVFMNLIDNACAYTKNGGVDISIKKDGKFVKIVIKDTGIGISKADQKKLFEKFSRGKNAISHNPSGSGLGLFIAKKIIRAHSGKIEIESEGIGKGTEARIFLAVKH